LHFMFIFNLNLESNYINIKKLSISGHSPKNYNYSKHYYGEKSYHNLSNNLEKDYYHNQYGLSDHDKVINYIKELINEKNKCPIELKEKLKDVLEFVEREEDVDYVKCEWMERIPKVMLWSENEFISYYIKISSKSNKNLNREWRSQASGVILKGSEAGGRDYS
jgi:hypothetical protein